MVCARTHVPLAIHVPAMQNVFRKTTALSADAQTIWLETPSSTVTRNRCHLLSAAATQSAPQTRHASMNGVKIPVRRAIHARVMLSVAFRITVRYAIAPRVGVAIHKINASDVSLNI